MSEETMQESLPGAQASGAATSVQPLTPGALVQAAVMTATDRVYRNGVEMNKGFVLTQDYIEGHRKQIEETMNIYTVYPDLFLDTIGLAGDKFTLFFYQRIFVRASMRYRYHYCVACFDESAEVITEDKVKSVKDVEAGDKVLTHNGWSTVLAPTQRLWNGNMVEIQGRDGIISPIRCTDTHEFYVVPRANENERVGTFSKKIVEELGGDYKQRKEFYRINCREAQAKWVQAKDLSCNDFLLSYIDERVEDVKWHAPRISSNHCTNLIKSEIEFDNNFAEWFGIWLAEGSWTDRAISFTIGSHEKRLYNRILSLTEQVFGLTHPTIYRRDANHSVIIQYNSKHLCLFFEQLYGRECDQVNQWTKYVPPSIMVGAPTIQLQLVKGWLDGDGYYREATSPRYKGTTVSAILAEQMQMILYRNFINPSITTELRDGYAKIYNVNVNGLFASWIHNAIESETPLTVDFKVRQGKDYPILVNGKYYMRNRIQKIQTIPNCEQTVYCMKVKDTPSFTVNGVLAHNCRAFSKTFVSILALILKCVFAPRTHAFIVAPAKSQAAKNSKDKIVEIFQHWPLLKKEIVGGDVSDLPGLYGKDYITLNFRNESVLDVVGANLRRSLSVMVG